LANSVEPGGHHHPAAVDDRHVIGDLIDVGQLMGREQHGGAPVRGMANQRLQHLFGRRRVEPGGRLVEHQQIGAAAERQQRRQFRAHARATAPSPAGWVPARSGAGTSPPTWLHCG